MEIDDQWTTPATGREHQQAGKRPWHTPHLPVGGDLFIQTFNIPESCCCCFLFFFLNESIYGSTAFGEFSIFLSYFLFAFSLGGLIFHHSESVGALNVISYATIIDCLLQFPIAMCTEMYGAATQETEDNNKTTLKKQPLPPSSVDSGAYPK